MDLNRQFFVKMLSDHLNRVETEIPYEIDWNEILRLAKSHQVEGIVYHQCKVYMPIDVRAVFDVITSSTFYYYVNRRAALREITQRLVENEIQYITVKGFDVAKYYPIPAYRTMVDCDILVHRQDMVATMDLMRNLGYSGIENDKADSWECVKNNLSFEIHDRLVSDADFLEPYQERFFNEYDPYVLNGTLDWNFHFLFLIMHLRKHFMNSGVGIRQFMDLAVLIKNCHDLDWRWIQEKLAELDLLRFAQSCFILVGEWFGVDMPFGCESTNMERGFYEQVTDRILRNGTFGNDYDKNRGNFERNILIKSKGYLIVRRIKLVFRNAFPSYGYMRTYPRCNYVDGRPYLLLFAWIHRLHYYSVRKNKNTIKRVMKGAFSDIERLEEQEMFFKKMGL